LGGFDRWLVFAFNERVLEGVGEKRRGGLLSGEREPGIELFGYSKTQKKKNLKAPRTEKNIPDGRIATQPLKKSFQLEGNRGRKLDQRAKGLTGQGKKGKGTRHQQVKRSGGKGRPRIWRNSHKEKCYAWGGGGASVVSKRGTRRGRGEREVAPPRSVRGGFLDGDDDRKVKTSLDL